jgi:hypothetical protein
MRRFATLVAAAAFLPGAAAEGLFDHLYEPGTLRVEDVVGMEVVAPDGAPAGIIQELLFDLASGRIESIALDHGATYPVGALVSSSTAGRVIAEPVLEPASAGASALRPAQVRSPSRAREGLIDLREGRLRPP